jgi:hypothetical protein
MTDTTTRNPPRNRRVWTVERETSTAVGHVTLRRTAERAPSLFQVTLRTRQHGTQVVCNGTAAMAYAYYQGFTDAAALAAPTPSTQED